MFLVIVRLMPHCNLLLTYPTHELALYMTTRWIEWWKCLPENVAHVMEEPYRTEKNRRGMLTMVQEKLRVRITLPGRLRQPVLRRPLILSHLFLLEVQLAEDILSILVSSPSRPRQIIYRYRDILFHDFSSEVLFSQTIGGAVTAIFSGSFQPAEPLLHITDLHVIGEKELSKRILRCGMVLCCRPLQPALSFYAVRNQQRTSRQSLPMRYWAFRSPLSASFSIPATA